MREMRVSVSDMMAGAPSDQWKQWWRASVEAAGHTIISSDDEISKVLVGDRWFVVGKVE